MVVYSSNSGAETSSTQSTTSMVNPPFTFTGIHRGHHAVTASSTFKSASPALTTSTVVFVEGNSQQNTVDVYLGGPG